MTEPIDEYVVQQLKVGAGCWALGAGILGGGGGGGAGGHWFAYRVLVRAASVGSRGAQSHTGPPAHRRRGGGGACRGPDVTLRLPARH